jgi:hypothetical protein
LKLLQDDDKISGDEILSDKNDKLVDSCTFFKENLYTGDKYLFNYQIIE